MENILCTPIKSWALTGCDENYKSEIKTLEVDESFYEKYKGVIEEAKRTGQPIIIDAGDLSVAQTIAFAGMGVDLSTASLPIPPQPIQAKCDYAPKVKALYVISNPEEPLPALTPEQLEKNKAWQMQGNDLAAANIPEATKKLIAAEFMRLKRLHPNWKPNKAARKAGEKYNVKFVFE